MERKIEDPIEGELIESEGENLLGGEAEKGVDQELAKAMGKEIDKPVEGETEKIVGEELESLAERAVEKEIGKPLEEGTVEGGAESLEEKAVGEELESLAGRAVEREIDKPAGEVAGNSRKKYKKIVIGIIVILSTLLVFYLGMTFYFINHFYIGSEINGMDVSIKSVEDVESLMASELQNYRLNLKELDGKREQITADDVGLSYPSDKEFKKLKESQNPFNWISAYFNTEGFKMTVGVTYDEKLLKERVDKLSCFDSSTLIEPRNPSFRYTDNQYVIVDEILGNKVDKAILYEHIVEALLEKENEIDLDTINCYIKPLYHSKSPKIMEVKDTLNHYVSSEMTYTFGNSTEVLGGDIINKWLTVDENFGIIVDEGKVGEYIDNIAEKYSRVGRIRNFDTSSGQTIQIGGGDFSRPINKVKEREDLILAIKEGQTITKEPVYGQTDFSQGNEDIGDTYIEIDLSNQHIWFYKRGSLIIEGDIVTGNVSSGHTTPKGIYSLKYKVKNVVLRGPGYAAPVSFWMPFNGGIGMHDANWRSVFGGNIYKTNGSHGCINCPSNVASAIYNNIEPDTPVICY